MRVKVTPMIGKTYACPDLATHGFCEAVDMAHKAGELVQEAVLNVARKDGSNRKVNIELWAFMVEVKP